MTDAALVEVAVAVFGLVILAGLVTAPAWLHWWWTR